MGTAGEPRRCARCGAPEARHAANDKAYCCDCYEKIVDKLLAMVEGIRKAVK